MAVFSGTTAMQVVIKRTGGLVWKNWPMNHTRRANAKKRHIRLGQVEAILRACSQPPPPKQARFSARIVRECCCMSIVSMDGLQDGNKQS